MTRRAATLKDVALLVGVHPSTVSRALSPETRDLVADGLAEKIARAAKELDYQPNSTAFSLRTKRSMTVGIVVPDITNPIFPPIVRGIESAIAAAGYMAIVVNTDGDAAKEAAVIRLLRARGVDGLILATALVGEARAALADLPAISVNRRLGDLSVSSVTNDDSSGIMQALHHVAALGHRRVAHITGPMSSSTGLLRHDAFCAGAAALGLEGWQDLIVNGETFRELEGYRCAHELLDRDAGFTAIIGANDLIALGAIRAMAERGLSCPDDISVTGFNDIPFVDRLQPPLTTLRIDGHEVGKRAGQLFLDKIATPAGLRTPLHDVLPVTLVTRGTTGPMRRR